MVLFLMTYFYLCECEEINGKIYIFLLQLRRIIHFNTDTIYLIDIPNTL